jgi:hypothetical protein
MLTHRICVFFVLYIIYTIQSTILFFTFTKLDIINLAYNFPNFGITTLYILG